jgi:hypothetical protein
MLKPNPLCPPPRFGRAGGGLDPTATDAVVAGTRRSRPFVSAEDFDATGILAGMDPCESRYWWVPELHGSVTAPVVQATSRPASRPPAAA